jgi:HSP20 family protein
MADVPDVTPEHVDVRVDNNVLTIRAQSGHASASEPGYREYQLVNYFRQFELSDKFNQDQISAELKHSVLTLNLPKAEKSQTAQDRCGGQLVNRCNPSGGNAACVGCRG